LLSLPELCPRGLSKCVIRFFTEATIKIPASLVADASHHAGRTRAKLKKKRIDSKKGFSPIERLCADKGLRMTVQRRIVARVLSTSHDHPNVEQLHRRVQRIDPQIALSTIYRIVHVLCGTGIVEKHAFGSGRARLELVPNKHHNHLIDVRSGNVIEFRSDEIERLLAQIADRLGYRILEHRLELYGVPLNRD
jgi:Fur family transcriptional regulator, ferric uptake regulator